MSRLKRQHLRMLIDTQDDRLAELESHLHYAKEREQRLVEQVEDAASMRDKHHECSAARWMALIDVWRAVGKSGDTVALGDGAEIADAVKEYVVEAFEAIATLTEQRDEHRKRAAHFGAILQDIAHALPVLIGSDVAGLPAAVRAEVKRADERDDEAAKRAVMLEETRTALIQWQNIVTQVRDLLPASASPTAPVDIPAALAEVLADLRDERQKALSRAAKAERNVGTLRKRRAMETSNG